jgi:hypothetical protein
MLTNLGTKMKQPTLEFDKIGAINKIQKDFEFSSTEVISVI